MSFCCTFGPGRLANKDAIARTYRKERHVCAVSAHGCLRMRVARISWRGGGAFLEGWDNCKRPWPKFSLLLNQIEAVFRPKTVDLQKKRSSPKLSRIFPPKSQIQTVLPAESRQLLYYFGSQISLGGLFSFFEQKSALKALKTGDFAYFSGQWGGLSPPRPPSPGYATAPAWWNWWGWIYSLLNIAETSVLM